jgi:hypothetical protein
MEKKKSEKSSKKKLLALPKNIDLMVISARCQMKIYVICTCPAEMTEIVW